MGTGFERLKPYLVLAPVVALLAVFVYLPVLVNFRYSLHHWSALSPTWDYVGLANFRELLGDPLLRRVLANNAAYAVVSLICQVGFALVLAAILEAGLFSRRLAGFFRVALFIPSILPITAIGMLWTMLYQPTFGLFFQLFEAIGLPFLARAWLGDEPTAIYAVISVSQWQWTGYMVVLLVVAIRAIPRERYEAAVLDGAGGVRQFLSITLPGVRETTLFLASITVFGAIKVFDIVWVMTGGGPNNASDVLGSWMYRTAFRSDLVGLASAIAVVMFLLSQVFGLLQLRLQRERDE